MSTEPIYLVTDAGNPVTALTAKDWAWILDPVFCCDPSVD
jgi:hypothetical protein